MECEQVNRNLTSRSKIIFIKARQEILGNFGASLFWVSSPWLVTAELPVTCMDYHVMEFQSQVSFAFVNSLASN